MASQKKNLNSKMFCMNQISELLQFSLINENPVAITVKNLKRALPSLTTLSLLHTQSEQSSILNMTKFEKSDLLEIYREVCTFQTVLFSFILVSVFDVNSCFKKHTKLKRSSSFHMSYVLADFCSSCWDQFFNHSAS